MNLIEWTKICLFHFDNQHTMYFIYFTCISVFSSFAFDLTELICLKWARFTTENVTCTFQNGYGKHFFVASFFRDLWSGTCFVLKRWINLDLIGKKNSDRNSFHCSHIHKIRLISKHMDIQRAKRNRDSKRERVNDVWHKIYVNACKNQLRWNDK